MDGITFLRKYAGLINYEDDNFVNDLKLALKSDDPAHIQNFYNKIQSGELDPKLVNALQTRKGALRNRLKRVALWNRFR